MDGNSFGKAFKISTFGESHGKGIGVIIDGCPAGLTIDELYSIRNAAPQARTIQNCYST